MQYDGGGEGQGDFARGVVLGGYGVGVGVDADGGRAGQGRVVALDFHGIEREVLFHGVRHGDGQQGAGVIELQRAAVGAVRCHGTDDALRGFGAGVGGGRVVGLLGGHLDGDDAVVDGGDAGGGVAGGVGRTLGDAGDLGAGGAGADGEFVGGLIVVAAAAQAHFVALLPASVDAVDVDFRVAGLLVGDDRREVDGAVVLLARGEEGGARQQHHGGL